MAMPSSSMSRASFSFPRWGSKERSFQDKVLHSGRNDSSPPGNAGSGALRIEGV